MFQLNNALKEELGEQINEAAQQLLQQVQTPVDAIINQLDKQVTGILIQGVNSPVFGDFRTPLGVKSNILFNWYGYNERNKAIEFPSNDAGLSATGAPAIPATLEANSTYTAPIGYYGDSYQTDVTLGKVYVTLNPVGANFDDLVLSLEKSNGERLPYTITLKSSDYELMHGYSRAEANNVNGFYEGEVKMALNDDNVGQIEVKMEEDLKAALKDAVKDPSKVTAKALVNAVFQQLQGKIPAYALRYDWTTGEVPSLTEGGMDPGFSAKSWSVLSQYDLAVATALPLSYNTFAGVHGSTQLPTFGHIENLINKIKEAGNITLDFGDPFVINGIEIDLGTISFESVGTDLKITIPSLKVDDKLSTESKTIIVKGDESGMNTMLNDIKEAINSTLLNANSELEKEIDKMTAQIEKQVNDMMTSINDQISGKIDGLLGHLDKLEPYYGKINAAIDLYNKIANKVNNFIADPNAYLQVAAFYNQGGANYGIVSGKLSDPTPFVGNGEAFDLYLSSYTGELIVPACKKYVAITGVYKNGAAVTTDLNALNNSLNTDEVADFNSAIDGNKIKVAVPAAALDKGNVYEFTYQALDYRGYTSTKKFYIEVK